MSDDDTVEMKTSGLDKLHKLMKGKGLKAKVGILGAGNVRSGGGNSNASVGAAHEFGTSTLPQRSFLRMPISEKLPGELEKSGAFDKDSLNQVLKDQSFKSWVEKVAIMAVAVVQQAFDTGGFGKWTPSNMDKKKVKQTLVETQQLRNSISYEVS